MSILIILIKACLIGVAIAAPVGPIGLLCIRKTIEMGLMGALAVGLGAALADSVYGLIASTGLTVISDFLLGKEMIIKLVGGTLLLTLALETLKSPNAKEKSIERKSLLILSVKVFLLTLSSPMTILTFLAIFTSISGPELPPHETGIMVLGIFMGSMLWWLILGTVVAKAHTYLSENSLKRIRHFSTAILSGFGLWSIGKGLVMLW